MITKSGIYDLTDDEYHADPVDGVSASCSILQLIDTQSPLHAMWQHPKLHPAVEKKEATNLDIGTAFHTFMTGKGPMLVPCDFKDWRTKEARAMRGAVRADGKIPLLAETHQRTNTMAQEATIQLATHDGWERVADNVEKTFIWKEDSFWFRIKPDFFATDNDIIFDLKATDRSVAPESFQRHIYSMGYDFRAAYYARGYKALKGRPLKEYRFIAVEVEPPHALAIFSLTPEAMDFAAKRVERAISIWKECLTKNEWPAYPKKVCYVTPPRWAENSQIEREIQEAAE